MVEYIGDKMIELDCTDCRLLAAPILFEAYLNQHRHTAKPIAPIEGFESKSVKLVAWDDPSYNWRIKDGLEQQEVEIPEQFVLGGALDYILFGSVCPLTLAHEDERKALFRELRDGVEVTAFYIGGRAYGFTK